MDVRSALWFIQEKLRVPERSENVWDGALVMARNSSFAGESRIPYLRIRARSSAVVEWIFPLSLSVASSPLGVRKYVSSHPSSTAFRFIISAKFSTLPPTASAIAAAESLWDSSIMEYRRSLRQYLSPFLTCNFTSGIDAARSEIRTSVSGPAFSSARIQVMIFVVLAIGRTSVSFFPYRMRPVSPSSKTAAREFRRSGSVSGCAAADSSAV